MLYNIRKTFNNLNKIHNHFIATIAKRMLLVCSIESTDLKHTFAGNLYLYWYEHNLRL